MRVIFLFLVFFVFGFPAISFAGTQETITIIHDDGRKEVLALPSSLSGEVLEVDGKRYEEVEVPVAPLTVEEIKPALEKAEKVEKKIVKKPVPQRDFLAFVPPRKPDVPEVFLSNPDKSAITPSEALRLAIGLAPAARNFSMRMRGANYAVIFKTENGDYWIVLDPINGAIVERGYLR